MELQIRNIIIYECEDIDSILVVVEVVVVTVVVVVVVVVADPAVQMLSIQKPPSLQKPRLSFIDDGC